MALATGTRLGPYEVLRLLGAGGMGEVYRARDTRLSREVALKVLAPDLASNPERLARFEREARAASALSHPAIVSVYDIGQANGHWFIAMELVEGDPLRALLTDRAVATRRLLDVAIPIAQGLARAHRSGIVHRDLKPENVMVGPDGVVKIVDFGIAKLLGTSDNAEDETVRAQHHTEPGAILGTVSYMSPEQTAGRPVDARSDQFSFGTMLMEMATGRHPFLRQTAPQTQAAIIEHHPAAIRTINPNVPLPLAWIIDRCLAKDPTERYGSTDDLARDLARVRDHLSDPQLTAVAVPQPRRAGRAILFFGSLAVIAGLTWLLATQFSPTPQSNAAASHLALVLGGDLQYTSTLTFDGAVSPDGKSLVFAARSGAAEAQHSMGQTRLYLRTLEHPTPRLLGSGSAPFWSPDGQWVGFNQGGTLKKMRVNGESAVDILKGSVNGASWADDDGIVYWEASDRPVSGIMRVPAAGGTPQEVTTLDRAQGHTHHLSPQVLPGGRLLYSIRADGPKLQLAIQALDNGTPKIVAENAAFGRYIGDGLLLFQRGTSLLIAPLDLESETLGTAVPVVEDVAVWPFSPNWTYASGTLVYRPIDRVGRTIVWVDSSGKATPTGAPALEYWTPRLSPSGQLVAAFLSESGGSDILVFDTASGRLQPVTNDHQSRVPIWTLDGAHLIVHRRTSASDLFRWPLNVSSVPVQVTRTGTAAGGAFIARDGSMTYHQVDPTTGYDLWTMPADSAGEPRPLVRTPELEAGARLHPGERWFAFAAIRSGRDEIWIASYPDGLSRIRVATDGSREPIWSRDGRSLFYRLGTKMFAVSFQDGQPPALGRPRELFDVPYFSAGGPGNTQYDVAPDGRLLMMKEQENPRPHLVVLQHWRDKLSATLGNATK